MPAQPDSVFYYADRASFFQLIFLAIVAGLTAKHLSYREAGRFTLIAAGIVLPLYFCHLFSFEAKFDVLLNALVRSILISWFVACVTSIVASVCLLISKKVSDQKAAAKSKQKREEEERERQRKIAEQSKPRPAPPPPLSAKEKAERFARQAREEHEIEMELIRSLPLEDDERSVLETEAKIKLLRKLKERK